MAKVAVVPAVQVHVLHAFLSLLPVGWFGLCTSTPAGAGWCTSIYACWSLPLLLVEIHVTGEQISQF